MANVASLGYMVLGVSDLAAWEHYATRVIGFQIGVRSATELGLRMDERPYRILLEQGPEDDLRAAGWQVATPAEFESLRAQLTAHGLNVTVDAALARRRQVEALMHVADPNGYRHEIFWGPMHCVDAEPFRSPLLQGGFVTGRLGMGHFVALCRDVDEATDFHVRGLGLKVSGHIRPTGTSMTIPFFHAPNGRYHSYATGVFPGAKRLRHIGLELSDFNDLGRAIDRATDAGVVDRSLGMHPNAKTVSIYLKAPGGLGLELFFGEIVCDDDNWTVESYQQTSMWGHRPVG